MKNKFEIRGEITVISLKQRDGSMLESLIDTNDLEKLMKFNGTWYAKHEKKNDTYYVAGNLIIGDKRTTLRLHNWLMNTPINYVVDHINHDGLDNRRLNIRVVTFSENQMNRRKNKNNTSGYPGVYWNNQRKKWRAHLRLKGKMYYFGFFDSADDASKAAMNGREKYFGDKFLKEVYRNT